MRDTPPTANAVVGLVAAAVVVGLETDVARVTSKIFSMSFVEDSAQRLGQDIRAVHRSGNVAKQNSALAKSFFDPFKATK